MSDVLKQAEMAWDAAISGSYRNVSKEVSVSSATRVKVRDNWLDPEVVDAASTSRYGSAANNLLPGK